MMKDPSSGQPLTWARLGLIMASSMVGFFAGLASLNLFTRFVPAAWL